MPYLKNMLHLTSMLILCLCIVEPVVTDPKKMAPVDPKPFGPRARLHRSIFCSGVETTGMLGSAAASLLAAAS